MRLSIHRCARLKTRISLVRSSSIVEVTSSVLRQTTRFLRQVETLESTGIRIRSLAQSARQVRKETSAQLVRKAFKATSAQQDRRVTSDRQVRKVTLAQLVRSVLQVRKATLVQPVLRELASPFLVHTRRTQLSLQLSRQEIQVTAILSPVTCTYGLQLRHRGSTLVRFKDRQVLKVTSARPARKVTLVQPVRRASLVQLDRKAILARQVHKAFKVK
jgi:hypothetical protein